MLSICGEPRGLVRVAPVDGAEAERGQPRGGPGQQGNVGGRREDVEAPLQQGAGQRGDADGRRRGQAFRRGDEVALTGGFVRQHQRGAQDFDRLPGVPAATLELGGGERAAGGHRAPQPVLKDAGDLVRVGDELVPGVRLQEPLPVLREFDAAEQGVHRLRGRVTPDPAPAARPRDDRRQQEEPGQEEREQEDGQRPREDAEVFGDVPDDRVDRPRALEFAVHDQPRGRLHRDDDEDHDEHPGLREALRHPREQQQRWRREEVEHERNARYRTTSSSTAMPSSATTPRTTSCRS
ncbi:hypothetical protein [Amycolatopsis sp. CA-128772]|uniref:hypothetical protein n=1 Tax=Amycolatopsis sp. CA-128772 TaxID=2073159 RepID=UPI0011B096F4|nr:hypothetical protein [Amycolatopsis sp. CA-128772]